MLKIRSQKVVANITNELNFSTQLKQRYSYTYHCHVYELNSSVYIYFQLQQLEDQLKKYVVKSRPYFDEKQLCQEQLATQKERIDYLQNLISEAKFRYSQSLKTLEAISEEIHMKRKDMYDDGVGEYPVGPREPGVGAENYPDYSLELEMFVSDIFIQYFVINILNL